MLYSLKTTTTGFVFDVQCSMKDKPATVLELVVGLSEGRIQWDQEYSSANIQQDYLQFADPQEGLIDYWEHMNRTPHFINWIPTDRL